MYTGRRPTGVTIIASLMLLGALLSLCGGLFKLGIIAPSNVFTFDVRGLFADSFSAVVAIVLAVANLILAGGMFNLAKWAYWITVFVQGLHLLNALRGGIGGVFTVGLIPLIVVAYLLLNRDVRNAFRT